MENVWYNWPKNLEIVFVRIVKVMVSSNLGYLMVGVT